MNIKQLRTSLKMTQLQLAIKLGVDPITVSRWERGLTVPHPGTLNRLKRLAKDNGIVMIAGKIEVD